ncbi:MAG: GNAT family N-acetyltransferase [Nocardioidaceae bacterium]
MHIERIDPMDLDFDTAEAMAELGRANNAADGVTMTAPSGPTRLKLYQHDFDGTPFAGLWLARENGQLVGQAAAQFPWRENTDAVYVRGGVHPDHQRQGIGRALLDAVRNAGQEAGRSRFYTGAAQGTGGEKALVTLGFEPIHTYAVSHIDLHDGPWARWNRLYDEALSVAADYELMRLVGPTPEENLEDVVALFAAINDAPMTDADADPDAWDTDRVRAYDTAMAERRQTVYRVMARHRETGAWAGHTVLCIDEFDPEVGHQEDTSVVTAHRGHRLGLLLKTEMLRWIAEERPEVRATETWNSVQNHHMLAVNESLGARVVDRHTSLRSG